MCGCEQVIKNARKEIRSKETCNEIRGNAKKQNKK
jgi:hypothetical protein